MTRDEMIEALDEWLRITERQTDAYAQARCALDALRAESREAVSEETAMQGGRWYAAEDIDRLVVELDRLLNGDGGAKAPKLCDIVAYLRSAPPRVPEGYVLVPKALTDKMYIAGGFSFCDRVTTGADFKAVEKEWERLLNAAPKPPQAGGEDE